MDKYVVENMIKQLIKADVSIKDAKVGILGFTFKENCPDTRNTRVIDVYNELKKYGITPLIVDPQSDSLEVEVYGLKLQESSAVVDLDAVIIAVSHDEFKTLDEKSLDKLFKNVPNSNRVIIDVKVILNRDKFNLLGYNYFRLYEI